MSIDLAISLGHNSSCVAIDHVDGNILCGFEEERLTGVKSDSAYPVLSIEKCMSTLQRPSVRHIYISHWFADGRLKPCKYYDDSHIKSLGAQLVVSVSKDITHHDAHNYSALAFAQSSPGFESDFFSLVVDGFGTQGECLSLYQSTTESAKYAKTRLLHRAFGYNKSLGILYQYATAFLGMKMQQDEYKLLGYEAHADELTEDHFDVVADRASKLTAKYFKGIMNPIDIDRDKDPIVNINALKMTKDGVFEELWALLNEFDIDDRTDFDAKVLVSILVQQVVEDVVLQIVRTYGIKKLICSGGVFMNVKLNLKLSQMVEKLCVMPLAGDQGAAIGLYHYHNQNLKWPNHLYWGHRPWNKLDKFNDVKGIEVYGDRGSFIDAVLKELTKGPGYVNIVTGDMEYGPRALCNTTTLAIPDRENTEAINKLNDRTTVMPMAPVMTEEMASKYLQPFYQGVHKSLEYMIAACVLNKGVDSFDGAAHKYEGPWFGWTFKTCRPQILSAGHPVYDVLEKIGKPLINTSFNYHGVPIVYDEKDIVNSHIKQNENGVIKTLILVESNQ